MASITIKNIPPALHQALKRRARRHARSVQREAVLCLQQSVGMAAEDRNEILQRIRRRRERMKHGIGQDRVTSWIDEDRK